MGENGFKKQSKKRFVQFIKSCSNSAKPFDLLKETFNEMTFFVQVIINGPRLLRIAFGRDYNHCVVFLDICEDFFGAIGFIAK